MASSEDIGWFKSQFAARITTALQGTPFDVDMIAAIACQETGELWGAMRKVRGLTPDRVVALCCGDTLDADGGRRAFPRTKADLLAVPHGQEMFDIGRAALLAMAEHVPAYAFARNRPNKFCHGYGMFQYDLQFFLTNPGYFLNREYEDFDKSLARALGELSRGLRKLGLQDRAEISDLEFCHVAICYNTGGFVPARGLRQGHQVNGKFYGEFIRDHLAQSRRVAGPAGHPAVQPPAPGTAPLPPAAPLTAAGPFFRVETTTSNLLLRSEPRKSVPSERNVKAGLPDGMMVRAVSGTPVGDYLEVEAVLGGTLFRGFAAARFLVRVAPPPVDAQPQVAPAAPVAAVPPLPEARLAQPADMQTKRTAFAGALELKEPDMPQRQGDTPDDLRADLGRIIAWLDPENIRHKRYQPRDGLTFCNIYAHDYCTRAGVYLPRVWWTGPALVKLTAGQRVEARINNTVDEMRANSLFRWLRDFGEGFGWRRAASLTDLQAHANLGGVALIVARRREDGRSGHIVAVVPETATDTARRDERGQVTMPLQSQAGAVNFNYGRSTLNWWNDPRFAEFAFWIHA